MEYTKQLIKYQINYFKNTIKKYEMEKTKKLKTFLTPSGRIKKNCKDDYLMYDDIYNKLISNNKNALDNFKSGGDDCNSIELINNRIIAEAPNFKIYKKIKVIKGKILDFRNGRKILQVKKSAVLKQLYIEIYNNNIQIRRNWFLKNGYNKQYPTELNNDLIKPLKNIFQQYIMCLEEEQYI